MADYSTDENTLDTVKLNLSDIGICELTNEMVSEIILETFGVILWHYCISMYTKIIYVHKLLINEKR